MELYEVISLIINAVIMIAGFSAVIIYILQRRDARKTAASLIVLQIDQIESVVLSLRKNAILTNEIVYKSKVILTKNYWEETKHLLSKKLGHRNIKFIEEFYSQAEELEKSRKEICHELVKTWEHKSLFVQQRIAVFSESRDEMLPESIEKFERQTKIFTANLPIDILLTNLSQFKPLSGGEAYERLVKLSYN